LWRGDLSAQDPLGGEMIRKLIGVGLALAVILAVAATAAWLGAVRRGRQLCTIVQDRSPGPA